MASEVTQHGLATSSLPNDAPLTNGDHNPPSTDFDATRNADAFHANAAVSKSDTTLDVSDGPSQDVNSGGPTPVVDVAPGIAPVADFIPKDAPNSHPTPPPDEPLVNPEPDIDTEMTSDDVPAVGQPAPAADLVPASIVTTIVSPAVPSTESSLVRPREEDDDGNEEAERAAKRSRVTEEPDQVAPSMEVAAEEVVNAVASAIVPTDAAHPKIENDQDISMTAELITAPAVQVPKSENLAETKSEIFGNESSAAETIPQPSIESVVTSTEAKPTVEALDAPQEVLPAAVPSSIPESDSAPPADTSGPVPSASASASSRQYSKDPVTTGQTRFLTEKMKNLKKTKASLFFLNPVDPVALNIPNYPEIIKHPMDLGLMERKLKEGQYANVQAFADDFYLIVGNTRTFNGPDHPVTHAGNAMEAYFHRMMQSVPSATQVAPPPKKASPKPAPAARRESRSAAAPPPGPAASAASGTAASDTFALQPDGTPQIRRESTTNRPARAIKPPPARELSYAKPKRKEHQLELKFCENVLEKIRSPRYGRQNHLFLTAVDPVALNIPHYRQVVKNPMDLGHMAQKLKNGEYGKASEFKKDFDLIIANCLAFNPPGNPVRDIGIDLQRSFEQLWREKESWEKKSKAAIPRATSASDEDSDDDEEEEEEEEAGSAEQARTIQILQKQLADMQNALAGLHKAPKQKKAKAPKAASKKASVPASKSAKSASSKSSKPKKPRQVTYEEKQEISEAVGKMDNSQVEELTRIITTNCKKYAEQEEMELEIDDLPNDVQSMLLTYVRSLFGNPNKNRVREASPDDIAGLDDDDFEPERRSSKGGSKRKKHKPMGKNEQQSAIANIQKQLQQFQNHGTSGSASPTTSGPARAESSDDEDSEESEEE